MRELTDTVLSFIDRAAELHGRMEAQRFAQSMHANCTELRMQSPIEHLFWIACRALCDAAEAEFNPTPLSPTDWPAGIYLLPQARIGQYRADFVLKKGGPGPARAGAVVVELDGHDFHDKDKRQRSYEKRRDRDLTRAGFKVIHFTGSDVVKDPFACAWEALEMVGAFADCGAVSYNPQDPLGGL